MYETPFCVSLLCFGGQNTSLVFNQRQLVEAIFAGICVCTSIWEAAASLHRDSPLEWAQFLAKTETNSWQSRAAFFSPPSFDHMPESQEASELFVRLSHIRACTVHCLLTIKLFVFDYFNRTCFIKTSSADETVNKMAWLIGVDVPIFRISHSRLLLRNDNVSPNLGSWRRAPL